jgi:hypothetical protein
MRSLFFAFVHAQNLPFRGGGWRRWVFYYIFYLQKYTVIGILSPTLDEALIWVNGFIEKIDLLGQ